MVYGDPGQQSAPKPSAPAAAAGTTEADDDVVSTILPSFATGESGPHQPKLDSKMTQPPKDYTEAALLRGMETAGRNIDDEELRLAMKENGIGRPSTRAAIIETLFKRNYIRRDKKRLLPTPTGIELIGLIKNPTLKSAELTGQWERKLRQIEKGELSSEAFLGELTQLVRDMVQEVQNERGGRMISAGSAESELRVKSEELRVDGAGPTKRTTASAPPSTLNSKPLTPNSLEKGLGACPACKTGHILRGKTAFGCARFREGCQFRLPTELLGKKFSDPQIKALLGKGRTPLMKGFVAGDGGKFDAALVLNARHEPELLPAAASTPSTATDPGQIPCPVCRLGTMLRGKAAYGCSRFRDDCQFRVPFEWGGKALTDTQMKQLLRRGETGVIKGFVSPKNGKKYDAALKIIEGRVGPVFGQA